MLSPPSLPSRPRSQGPSHYGLACGAGLLIPGCGWPVLEGCPRTTLPRASGCCLLPAPLHKLRGLGLGGGERRCRAEGECGRRGSWELRMVVSAKSGLRLSGLQAGTEFSELEVGTSGMGWLGGQVGDLLARARQAWEPLSRR